MSEVQDRVRGENVIPSTTYRSKKIMWGHLGSEVGIGSAQGPVKGLSFSIPPPAFLQGRSLAFCPLGISPSTPLSSPRASPCVASTAQAVGPGSGQRRSIPYGCPGRCSALRAYLLAILLATAHLQGLACDPKAPHASAPLLATGLGLGPQPRCLGSHQCPGSAS